MGHGRGVTLSTFWSYTGHAPVWRHHCWFLGHWWIVLTKGSAKISASPHIVSGWIESRPALFVIWRVNRHLYATGDENCGTGMTNYLLVVYHLFNHLALGRMGSRVPLRPTLKDSTTWSLAPSGASRLSAEIAKRNFINTTSNNDDQFSMGKIDWNDVRCADAAGKVQRGPPATNQIPLVNY